MSDGPVGRLQSVVLDADDIEALAVFYQALLGLERAHVPWESENWITIGTGPGPTLSFQRVSDYSAPAWPGQIVPQQAHLDVLVDDLDTAERAALALGARETGHREDGFRVYLDPAGHPFCLID